jgi:hypothetical protein
MLRRASIIGTLALGMAMAAIHGVPSMEQIASSARSIQRNFQNLNRDNSLNPVERFFFSIVLAKTAAPKIDTESAPVDMPRT